MFTITVLYEWACIIGTLKSIFMDAFGQDSAAGADVIEYYKLKTSDNFTSLDPSDVGLPLLKSDSLFTAVEELKINSITDASQIKPIDNVSSFAFLNQSGKNGNDAHASRVLQVLDNSKLILLNTTKGPGGELECKTWEELLNKSNSISYFWLQK